MVNRFTLAGLLTVLSIFGLGVLVFSVADGSEPAPIEAEADHAAEPDRGGPGRAHAPRPTATPKPKATPLQAAAKAAGCELKSPPNEGPEHVPQPTTAADYGSNPPTSGIHAPELGPGRRLRPQERPGRSSSPSTRSSTAGSTSSTPRPRPTAPSGGSSSSSRASDDGYHLLLFENQTKMPYAVAATAWDQLIGCKTFNAKTVKALDEFRKAYVDKGPELVP